jgi:CcmD family protein
MKLIKFFAVFLFSFISFTSSIAQQKDSAYINDSINNPLKNLPPKLDIPMADILYENGKIYLVVLVLLTIFAGIILYMIRIEKKLSKLENQK